MSKNSRQLSAWTYIRNNRRRSSAVITCVAMFVLLLYGFTYTMNLMIYPLSKAAATRYEKTKTFMVDFEIDEYETIEEWNNLCCEKLDEIQEDLSDIEGITHITRFRNGDVLFQAALSSWELPVYLFEDIEEVNFMYEFMDVKLVDGRLPEKEGEIVVDKALLANQGDEILDRMSTNYKIVGTVESDYYLAFGLALPNENNIYILAYFNEDFNIEDAVKESGYDLSWYNDTKTYQEEIKHNEDEFRSVETIITVCGGAVIAFCLFIVLSMHIRDRRSEWCLLSSIGYSNGAIYSMILRELLICFGLGTVIGNLIAFIGCLIASFVLKSSLGFMSAPVPTRQIIPTAVVLIVIMAVLQIPVFVSMHQIQTVDKLEE